MHLGAALRRGRRAAEARMGSVNGASDATVRHRTGRKVQDETTGLEVPEWETVHTDLPCRLANDNGAATTRTVSTPGGQMQVAVRRWDCPADTDGLVDGDLIEITAGENAGTVWRLVEATFADQQTARRCPVAAEQRPSEWPTD